MPRTTIDLEGPLLERLKRIAHEEGKTLGRVASELLAQALANRKRPSPHLRWTTQEMKARVDLEDKDAVQAALDAQ